VHTTVADTHSVDADRYKHCWRAFLG